MNFGLFSRLSAIVGRACDCGC